MVAKSVWIRQLRKPDAAHHWCQVWRDFVGSAEDNPRVLCSNVLYHEVMTSHTFYESCSISIGESGRGTTGGG
jgi:hypothetical protein